MEEATAALGTGRVVVEQFFLDNRTYDGAPCPTSTEYFAITCVLDATTYTLTATGSGKMAGFVYTLDESRRPHDGGPLGSGQLLDSAQGGYVLSAARATASRWSR